IINAIKRARPNAHISWVIQPVPYQLVKDHESVDQFFVFKRRRGLDALKSYRDLREQMRGQRFDLLINLQVYFKAGLITAMTPAKVKLGFDRARARDMNWIFTNEKIRARPSQHVQDQYFEFLEHLNIPQEPLEWRLSLSADEQSAQREFFATLGRTCGVVVGTSKPQKNWAPDRYAAVIDALETQGVRCILVGGPSPIEREAAARIEELARVKPINALGDDVRRALWLLDGASFVISPDTGPLHMARAVDTPVVGLYGYTDPKRYGPYRKYGDLIVDGYPAGMQTISVEAVLNKAQLALQRYL
ncbi:MAG TPA: glycosyltransferase family 9 protein, partial [Longimicrobiales bacterium]|nr:glycosyltransferase family 9 protein [Longimicrobiales bacterium]